MEIKQPILVTLSGTPGSGKSSVAEILTRIVDGTRIYVGEIRRKIAQDKGLTLEGLNEYALTHPETDIDIDQSVAKDARRIYCEGKSVIVEGRTQFYFLPESFKLYICSSLEEGARRIYEYHQKTTTNNRNETKVETLEEMIAAVKKREEIDARRYLNYYGFDHRNKKHYDAVIDSTNMTKEEVMTKVLELLSRFKKGIN